MVLLFLSNTYPYLDQGDKCLCEILLLKRSVTVYVIAHKGS